MYYIEKSKKHLKKKLIVVGCVCLLSLSACGVDKNVEEEAQKVEEESQKVEEEAQKVEEEAQKVEEESVSIITSAETVSFEKNYENGFEFAVIKGLDNNNSVVWEYETEKYECAELDRITEIGINEDRYYFVEDGTIISLKISDGALVWKNEEFEGAGISFAFGKDGTIYLCGYYGPDFYAIDKNGNTISKILSFDSEYYWASKIEVFDNYVEVTMENSLTESLGVFEVDLSDFSYKKKEQNNDNYLSNEQLCELARIYYEKVTLSPAPENVIVDGENEDMVKIWLYQDFGDHVATMDWYTVNRYTGEGTNVDGEYINLLESE